MKYVMYGSPQCTYCNSAKDLMEHKGIPYEYRDITLRDDWKAFVVNKGLRSVPQIFMEDDIGQGMFRYAHIGGYDALCEHLQD